MYNLQKIFAFLALATLSQLALALPEPVEARPTTGSPGCPSCYTYTETKPFTKTQNCPSLQTCPPHPLCLILTTKTVTVPPSDKACPVTPTLVVTAPSSCPTCITGCDTSTATTTITAAPTYK